MDARTRVYEASERFATSLPRELEAMPYFRWASDEECERSYAAYQRGNISELCREWAAVAQPTRAEMPGILRIGYAHTQSAPRLLNASIFLDSVRAALRAGEQMRAGLEPRLRAVLEREFPYLEHRHEHVPAGSSVPFEFPGVFANFLRAPDLDDSRARWQLAVGLNEVQQSTYTRYAAEHLGLPELVRHAQREEALAHNYFAHWSPRCTPQLWRETILVLDALNAASFGLVCEVLLPRLLGPRGWFSRQERAARWDSFVAGLDEPQWLMPPPS